MARTKLVKGQSSSKQAGSAFSTALSLGNKALSLGRKAINFKNTAVNKLSRIKTHTKRLVNKGFHKINHAQASILDKVKPKAIPRTIENNMDYINNTKQNEARASKHTKDIWQNDASKQRGVLDNQIKSHFQKRAQIEEQAFQRGFKDHATELRKSQEQFKQLGLTGHHFEPIKQQPIHETYKNLTRNHYNLDKAAFNRGIQINNPDYHVPTDKNGLAYAKATKAFRAHPITGVEIPTAQSARAHGALVRQIDQAKETLKDSRKTTPPSQLKDVWKSSRVIGGKKCARKN